MKKLFAFALLTAAILVPGHTAHAATNNPVGIQVRPLLYHETLKANTTEQGFIDVSNPTTAAVTLDTSVQLFTQTDNQGSLKFYDASYLNKAIVPDLKEFNLGPRQAVRLYFTVNSGELPDGDVLAAIFVTNKTTPQPLSITPAVRVGTLLIFENGQPGPRNTAITDFTMPFFQFGSGIHGTIAIKNTADPSVQSAFFADVKFAVTPWGKPVTKQSPLITSGRTRSLSFSLPSNQIGFYKLTVSTATASAYRWIFVVTGIWRTWVFVIIALIIIVPLAIWLIVRRLRGRL